MPSSSQEDPPGEPRAPSALTDQDKAKVFIAIAAYNEARAVGRVVAELHDAGYPNVVVVDDGSSDDTADVARRADASLLRHVVNRGQGAALQTAITYCLRAGALYVVTFDADGQHRAEDIASLLEPIIAGKAHIALGSRFLEDAHGVPAARRLLLAGAVLFTRLASGVKLTDAHNGLRAFSARAAAEIDIRLDRMAHASEIIDQILDSGLAVVEVPVRIRYSDYSKAKGQSGSAAFRVALDYILRRLGE